MDSSNEKTVGYYIKQVAAYGILITFFSIGLGLGSAFWSSTVSSLNQQIGQARIELTRTQDELAQVKANYFAYRTLHERATPASAPATDSTRVKQSSSPTTETKRIDAGKSAQFLGDLLISVVGVDYTGTPLRYQVTANVSAARGKVEHIANKDIGSVLTYVGGQTYQITLLEAGTFSAVFKVEKQGR
jgi:hypothetical protein